MALKETEGSLRAYFLFAGLLGAITSFVQLADMNARHANLTPGRAAALYIPFVAELILGCAYVVAGVRLKSALLNGAGWIKTLLQISGAMQVITFVLTMGLFGSSARSHIGMPVVALLITLYLYNSVKRLSAEAVARAQFNAPLPPSRAI